MVLPALQQLQNMEEMVDPAEVPADGIPTVIIMVPEQMAGVMAVMEIQAGQLPMIRKEEQGKEPQQEHGAMELYMRVEAAEVGQRIFKPEEPEELAVEEKVQTTGA